MEKKFESSQEVAIILDTWNGRVEFIYLTPEDLANREELEDEYEFVEYLAEKYGFVLIASFYMIKPISELSICKTVDGVESAIDLK